MRAVKKMCLDSGYGLGAQVSRWDDRPTESPARKIVTRAGAARSEDVELLELEEEDDEVVGVSGQEGEVTIEILDEEGNAVEVPENVGDEEWEDIGEDEDGSGKDEEDTAETVAEDKATPELKGDAEADHMVQDVPASTPGTAQIQESGSADGDMVIEDDAQLQSSEADDSVVTIQRSEPSRAEVGTQSPEQVPERLADHHGPLSPTSSPQSRKLDEGVDVAQPATSTSFPASPLADLVLTPKSIRSSPANARASSAPPEEEPKPLSPEKSFKPRLSDDTALLQAFINRAREDKSSRRLSVTQRESLSNRRDSDTVRQALASPAKPAESVLGDLDPNSPSPRKTAPAGLAERPELIPLALATTPAAQNEADPIEDPEQLAESSTKTRRSARGRRRPQVLSQSVYSAPPSQRIQIRGHGANVDLKKSEAQELAMLTRTNTRKNKQGSVLPKLRLVKMPPQNESGGGNEGGEETEGSSKEGRKGVKWNEQLVSFFEPGSVDTSGWSDEGPEERMPWEIPALPDDSDEETEDPAKEETVDPGKPKAKRPREVPQLENGAHTMGLTTPTLLPAAETPSKPKIRRLKAPRTASTPGKGPAPILESDLSQAEQAASTSGETQKAASTIPKPKRSRIATPAKGLTSASLLPSDVQQPVATEKKPPAKKRIPSKLPAPMPVASAPTASGNTTASGAGQGKENLTASTPAKRPPAGTLPQSKLFAPKLEFSSSVGARSAGLTFPNLHAQPPPEGGDEAPVPGLSSPAKKGRGRVVFGQGEAGEGGGNAGGGGNEGLGLKSPAKKRSSRRVPIG
ncbi:hypothetical protein Tdes44962_MAKER07929 [Teratosphaeria destructans]|uniref:Uncharacterized protein n=1 Tax=Teratosphaeria destructans TaxID=418781 RepID=A0A9W7W5L5_9PEZI|nr:hypothetical protein Tdes44962_MAKER07929 [Teratosphaeria destructans]